MGKQAEELDEQIPSEPKADPKEDSPSEVDPLDALRKELDETKDLLLRKQAEFENYRKRVIKEREEQRLNAQAEVFQELLPTLDALEKGLSSLEEVLENSELETYRQGYEFILREVRSVLDKFGVTEIPGLGSSFDPNIHEAILREVTSDYTDGEILDEFRKGYKLQHRLLRPVQVRVAVKPEKTADTEEKKEE
ncbi:MAG: nucleotide exchange factor GrpE [Acidobacteriota bacterium]|nr:nucleotide exchange factor GrpE [Acidobacteriota bacterium]